MPVQGPRKLPKIYPYLSQVPALLLASASLYGVYELANHGGVLSSIGPIQVYTVYPFSLVIFGALGAFLASRDKFKGVLAVMAAAAFFDMIGTFSIVNIKPDVWLFAVWMVPISLAFIVYQKSFAAFLWSKPFLAYLLVIMFWTYSPVAPFIQGWFVEPIEQVIWCSCFYLSFYTRTPRKVSGANIPDRGPAEDEGI